MCPRPALTRSAKAARRRRDDEDRRLATLLQRTRAGELTGGTAGAVPPHLRALGTHLGLSSAASGREILAAYRDRLAWLKQRILGAADEATRTTHRAEIGRLQEIHDAGLDGRHHPPLDRATALAFHGLPPDAPFAAIVRRHQEASRELKRRLAGAETGSTEAVRMARALADLRRVRNVAVFGSGRGVACWRLAELDALLRPGQPSRLPRRRAREAPRALRAVGRLLGFTS